MTRDDVPINRDLWDRDAPSWAASGERLWALERPGWGNWGVSDLTPCLLPGDMTGLDAIEPGCGTGYVSARMARRGARVTGIDISAGQLATARRLAQRHGADIRFIDGNAEITGLPDASFDFVISENGAAIWCPPEVWLAEAWRLLRPGGRLVFLGNHPLVLLCSPLDGAPRKPTRSNRSGFLKNLPDTALPLDLARPLRRFVAQQTARTAMSADSYTPPQGLDLGQGERRALCRDQPPGGRADA